MEASCSRQHASAPARERSRLHFLSCGRGHRGGVRWLAEAIVALALLTAGPGAAVSLGAGPGSVVPRFQHAECPAEAVKAITALRNARCGFLVVPENRARANGRTIRLAVAILPATSGTPAPDPIVHLTGGPGGISILQAQSLVNAGLNRDRDVILMDQRGEYYSRPKLTCPRIDGFNARALGLVYDALSTGRRHVAATRACRNRLAARGIDLGAFNTTQNAADFADLREALGIKQWNVFGISYGTDLALTLMREHPEGIRSVTLDSVTPPSAVSVGGSWGNAREGFDNLFRACAKQRACRARYPRLERTFTRLVRALERRPVTAQVRPAPDKPKVKVVTDGGALVNWLVQMAFETPDYPKVPAWIDQLAHGRPQSVAASRVRQVTPEGIASYGLFYGVACSEWLPYESRSSMRRDAQRAFPRYPASIQAPQFPFLRGDCRKWNVPKGPSAQRAVVRSRIPTLLVAGSFDAVTSPRWARLAARTLPNSTLITIPGVGHDTVFNSGCAQRVMGSFLATPSAPNTRCVARLKPPAFTVAPASTRVTR
jgi:pimeloyl-ACP methyl ester carboxylesterase